MSQLIMILGDPGSGKSRAGKNLNPKRTVWFNMMGKDLPWPGSRSMYKKGKNLIVPNLSNPRGIPPVIEKVMDLCHKKEKVSNLIIDDYQYLMALEYIQGEKLKEGWEKFTSILINSTDIFTKAKSLRQDLNVFLLCHTEEASGRGIGETKIQMKTVGKALREKFTPEGIPTIVLITDPTSDAEGENIYRFRTQTLRGLDPVKSPEGMFPLYIPNDFDLVARRALEYYEDPNADTPEKSKVLQGVDIEGLSPIDSFDIES